MVEKRKGLRAGRVEELEPGVFGRLNSKDQTLELSNGEKLRLSEKDKQELFPSNEQARKYAETKEEVEQKIKKTPGGEFFHQLGQKGVIGGLKEWGNKLTHTGDEYLRLRNAEREVGERISKESPWTSAAATGASFIPDIALTGGMSAVKAAPLLTALSAGPRILEEPGQVAAEAGIAAAGGKILDIGGNYLSKIAARRGASRAIPEMQAATRAENIAGKEAAQAENLAQRQQHNILSEKVKNENAALLHQHNLEMTARQNAMIEADNAYKQAKVAQAEGKSVNVQQNKRLKDEYELAKKNYDEAVRDTPRLQKEAQAEHSQNVVKNAEYIERLFPENSRLLGSQFGVNEFIENNIGKTGLAGSREASQASRILKSLFPEDEFISVKELSKRYRAIEDAIQRAPPEIQGVLSQFKNHLGERLPLILEDTIAHSKIMPSLSKELSKDISTIIKEIDFGKGQETTRNLLLKRANANLNNIIKDIGPDSFVKKLQNGEVSRLLRNGILTTEDFLTDAGFTNFSKLRKEGLFELATKELNRKHSYFVNEIEKRIKNELARSELKAMQAGKEASKKVGRDIRDTYGLAQPVPNPAVPVQPEPIALPPNLQNPIAPPATPPVSPKPSLNVEPTPPIPNTFSSQPEPTLAPSSNAAESIGDFLEKPLIKGSATNNLLKLGALKYALGPAALPVEGAALAGYGALKGLTSPGAVGEAARLSFKQGGIQAIEMMMQRYPSYNNGVLENPQERRSLNKEIEDDAEIPIEQKAVIQSKVNRGKLLNSSL
jgi:hypothetical protein